MPRFRVKTTYSETLLPVSQPLPWPIWTMCGYAGDAIAMSDPPIQGKQTPCSKCFQVFQKEITQSAS